MNFGSVWRHLEESQSLGYVSTAIMIAGLLATVIVPDARSLFYTMEAVGGLGLATNAAAHRQGPHIIKNGLWGALSLLALVGAAVIH